ncbi:uncharacterized protein [Halyomorpha halys]|uniref:uncharacterized protein isoform X1 n=2 Tax=Halyomorpha halys TaxID=286706 RepID=UPI0006D4DBF6|nr:uncharacterized protein LOC106685381 isoform X1 [Halyomorpha halys]
MVEVKQNMDMAAPRAWPSGHQYGLRCRCKLFPGEKRMKYIQPERAVSFKPCKIYRSPETKMPDHTTYKQSFEAFEPSMLRNCKGKPLLARENLTPAGDFSDLTTHKMSFGAWPGVTRQKIYYPRDHRLSGEGPMAEVTTHKHDYTPKCIDTPPKIIRPNNLGFSSAPMSDDSVMSMSYKVPDYRRFEPSASFKPERRFLPPKSPVESDTVHKLSFMPFEPQPKQEVPWAKPKPYIKPGEPLDGHTVYNGSYIAPGRMMEDPYGHCTGCYCIYPTECYGQTGERPTADICPVGYDPNKDPPRPPPIMEDFPAQ